MLIVILVVVVLIVVFIASVGNSVNNQTIEYREPEILKPKPAASDAPLLYKTKGIKRFDIVGTQFRNVSSKETGKFVGYVKPEDNLHDQYAVAIYKENGLHIGYTPKNNKRLSETLKHKHGGKLFIWGSLNYNKSEGFWYGIINIPIGYTERQVEEFKNKVPAIKY